MYQGEDSEREEFTRYTLVFQIMCFKQVGNDLIMEKLSQVDFRQDHSEKTMEQYLKQLNFQALYWHQDLLERVSIKQHQH